MARGKKVTRTKLEILRCATELFLTEGYTATYVTTISKRLGISTGNLTFYYPTKEHLLAELTTYLCEYHQITLEQEVEEGRTSLLAYLLEITSMMAVCEESEVAKDLYTAVYRHAIPLKIIREADTENAKVIFEEFCPDWEQEDYALTVNAVTGLEYASLMKENAEEVPLDRRIAQTLNMLMRAYQVPEELRKSKIDKVLRMDYRKIGRQFVEGFVLYVENTNEQALEAIKR